MNITQKITLDFTKKSTFQYISAKQGDNCSRFVVITLTDNEDLYTPPDGVIVNFRAQKPDGTMVLNQASVNDDGTVTVELTQQILAISGNVFADLFLVGTDHELLSSVSFIIRVEPAPVGHKIDSQNEFLVFLSAVEKAEQAATQAAQSAQRAEQAASQAANKLSLDGGTMQGPLDMGQQPLQNVPSPVSSFDAANKRFVDARVNAEEMARKQEIALERARIDSFATLPPGETAGNAELLDIRIGHNSHKYATAGEAVRAQVDQLSTDIAFTKTHCIGSGFKFSNSPFALKHDDGILLRFVRGTFTNGAGFWYDETATRCIAILNYKGQFHLYNFGNAGVNIIQFDNDNTQLGATGYITEYHRKYTAELGRNYVIVIKDNDNPNAPISDEFLARVNDEIKIYTGEIEQDDYIKMDYSANLISDYKTGFYVSSDTGALIPNADMVYTDPIKIKPNTRYTLNYLYVQLAFYTKEKQFISGFYCKSESVYPEVLYNEIISPYNAEYVAISTRNGNQNSLMFSELDRPTVLKSSGTQVLNKTIPKSLILDEDCHVVYDVDFDTSFRFSDFAISEFRNNGDGYWKAKNSGTIFYSRLITMDKSRVSFVFKCNTGSIIRCGYDASLFNQTYNEGLFAELNTSQKTFEIYTWNKKAAQEKTSLGKVSFDFDVVPEKDYCITVEKNTIYNVVAEFFDADCPDEVVSINFKSDVLPTDSAKVDKYARCWGGGIFEAVSGGAYIKNMCMIHTGTKYPKVAIMGDSYVENGSRVSDCSYARRLYTKYPDKVMLSGMGGCTTTDLVKRLPVELNLMHPKYVVASIGLNDTNYDRYVQNMQKIISLIKSAKAEPILITISRRLDYDNLPFMRKVNAFVKSSGYKYVDVASVLSTGDSETQDERKYMPDKVHPNIKGGLCIYKWVESHLGKLFY